MPYICLLFVCFPGLKMEPSILHILSEQCTTKLHLQPTMFFLHIPTCGHLGYSLFTLISTKPLRLSLDMSSSWICIFISLGSVPSIEISGSWEFRLFISFYKVTKTIARTLQRGLCHDRSLPTRCHSCSTLVNLIPFSVQTASLTSVLDRYNREKTLCLCLHFCPSYSVIIVHVLEVSCSLGQGKASSRSSHFSFSSFLFFPHCIWKLHLD